MLKNYPEFRIIYSFKQFKSMKELRKKDEKWGKLHNISMRWLKVTVYAWIGGFVVLGVSLYFLDSHDLLINYSKGIYR